MDIFIVNGIAINSSGNQHSPFVGIYVCENKEEAIGKQMEFLKKSNQGAISIHGTLVTETCREFIFKIDNKGL